MPPEIAALIDKPWLLILVLAAGAIPAMFAERLFERQDRARRRAWWQRRKGQEQGGTVPFRKEKVATPVKGTPERTALDATEQLRCVMEAEFSARPLLNRPEAAVFKALDAAVIARNPGWQVMAQVSLGEFLSSQDQAAYGAVNSKRVDFALMDEACRVRHALEYQGTGHHLPGGAAAARDAVKKEALRKAGIGYHEVVAGHTTPAELRRLVEKLVPGAN
jgi:hypothetical protein